MPSTIASARSSAPESKESRADGPRLRRPLLGVIANGSKSSGPSPYAYAKDGKSSGAVASADGASSSEELAPTAGA
jgi:hypothetical protein